MSGQTTEASLIVYPFYPFNSSFQYEFVKKMEFKYSIEDIHFIDLKQFSGYSDLMEKSMQLINSSKTPVILIAFGIFARIAGILAEKYREKVKSILFVEPDFTNIIPLLDYKRFFRKNDVHTKLIRFYNPSGLHADKYFHKGKNDSFVQVLDAVGSWAKEFKLFDMINNKIKFTVIWSVMQNECWPLPQVLTEDYNIPVISSENSIITYFETNNIIFIDTI